MPLIWVPGRTSLPSNTGVRVVVAAQTTSATANASRERCGDDDLVRYRGHARTSRSRNASAPIKAMDVKRARSGRTVQTASSCRRAWTPLPKMATTLASGRASTSVAAPEAAPVRMAVRAAALDERQRHAATRIHGHDDGVDERRTAPGVAAEDRDELQPQRAAIGLGRRWRVKGHDQRHIIGRNVQRRAQT